MKGVFINKGRKILSKYLFAPNIQTSGAKAHIFKGLTALFRFAHPCLKAWATSRALTCLLAHDTKLVLNTPKRINNLISSFGPIRALIQGFTREDFFRKL